MDGGGLGADDAPAIRPATLDDIDDVLALADALFREVGHRPEGDPRATAQHLLSRDADFLALLAFNQSVAIGLLTLSRDSAIYVGGQFGVINELYVRADVRSSGVGRALLQAAQRVGKLRGWLRLEVTAAPAAVDFYRENGFEGTGPHLKLVLAGAHDSLTRSRAVC